MSEAFAFNPCSQVYPLYEYKDPDLDWAAVDAEQATRHRHCAGCQVCLTILMHEGWDLEYCEPCRNRPKPARSGWDALWETKHPPTSAVAPTPSTGDAAKRLEGILATLNRAQRGQRNQTLHWCACRVADMLAAGELDNPTNAADVLESVAVGIGLAESESRATVRSGFATQGVTP